MWRHTVAYNTLKQFDRAIADFDQAIRIDPNDAAAYNRRGFAYLMSNRVQIGCADFIKACTFGECKGYEFAQERMLCR
jgi:tetratricopeptide (TPR) repeat protein